MSVPPPGDDDTILHQHVRSALDELVELLEVAAGDVPTLVTGAARGLESALWRGGRADDARAALTGRSSTADRVGAELWALAVALRRAVPGNGYDEHARPGPAYPAPVPRSDRAGPGRPPRGDRRPGDGVLIDPLAVMAATAGIDVAAHALMRRADLLDDQLALARSWLSIRRSDLVAPLDHAIDDLRFLARALLEEAAGAEDVARAASVADADLPACAPGPNPAPMPVDNGSAGHRSLPLAKRWWNHLIDGQVRTTTNSAFLVLEGSRLVADLAVHPRATVAALHDGTYPDADRGDRGGTFEVRPVGALPPRSRELGADPLARARDRVGWLLHRTGDETSILDDEIQLITHGPDRYTVVLPGVTDLTEPTLGLHPVHRSVRDLDRYAVRSAGGVGTADNTYARVVVDALAAAGVPAGAELLVVGHSFGADTALDLAADPSVNGGRYRITHVVAAAYHSEPQLAHVLTGTEVLVLQNRHDLVVGLEALHDRLTFDQPAPARSADRAGHQRTPVIWEFEGGFGLDAGHRQDRHVAALEATGDPGVEAFLRSVDDAGFTGPGSVAALDVSVPDGW